MSFRLVQNSSQHYYYLLNYYSEKIRVLKELETHHPPIPSPPPHVPNYNLVDKAINLTPKKTLFYFHYL
jgi:hypothetical protein